MSYFSSVPLNPVWTVLTPTVGNASGQLVIKASPGRLRRIAVSNTSTTTGYYVQLHDIAAVGGIVTGTRRWVSIPLPANGYVEYDLGDAPLSFAVGVTVALSSADLTYVAVTDTGNFSAQYA
jgi:hypothetical protein